MRLGGRSEKGGKRNVGYWAKQSVDRTFILNNLRDVLCPIVAGWCSQIGAIKRIFDLFIQNQLMDVRFFLERYFHEIRFVPTTMHTFVVRLRLNRYPPIEPIAARKLRKTILEDFSHAWRMPSFGRL